VVGTRKPFVAQHCVEAATELEEIFDLGLLIEDCSDEAMEQVRAIVLAHAHRELVERELGIW
jgi:hypothetical protein